MQWLPLSRHSAQTSPGTTRFFLSIHPLHLPYMIPCSYRASACKAVLPSCMAFYVISVRQTGDLPVVSLFPHPASFRFHLAMDTLTFGYILPTTGRIRDLHPLETCAAGRTLKNSSAAACINNSYTQRHLCFIRTTLSLNASVLPPIQYSYNAHSTSSNRFQTRSEDRYYSLCIHSHQTPRTPFVPLPCQNYKNA